MRADLDDHPKTTLDDPGARGEPPAVDGDEDLHSANDFVDYERTHFGRVDRLVFPFARQLKVDVRRRFEVDKEIFDESDWKQYQVMLGVFLLRLATYGMLVFFLWTAVSLYAACLGRTDQCNAGSLPQAVGKFEQMTLPFVGVISGFAPSLWLAHSLLILMGLVLIVLRFFTRLGGLGRVNQIGKDYAQDVHARHESVAMQIKDACTKSYSLGGTEKRIDRARKWPKIAAWNTRRNEALDRYTTAALWTVQIFFVGLELFFILLKTCTIALAVAYLLVHSQSSPQDFKIFQLDAYVTAWSGLHPEQKTFIEIMVAIAVIGWGPFSRRKNDFWTKSFTNKFGTSDDKKPHFFNAICGVVEECVRMAMKDERNKID